MKWGFNPVEKHNWCHPKSIQEQNAAKIAMTKFCDFSICQFLILEFRNCNTLLTTVRNALKAFAYIQLYSKILDAPL